MSKSSYHTKAFVQCCHGKHTVASSRTLLSDCTLFVNRVLICYNFFFLISNFRRVLNVVCFLVCNSRNLNFICGRFGTFCLFHLHRSTRLWRWNRQECSGEIPRREHTIFSGTKIFYVSVSTTEIMWRQFRHDRMNTKCKRVENK
jgi:hypothetical protein